MRVFDYREVELEPVEMEGCKGVKVRWLLRTEHGAEKFWMRLFEVEPGGYTPYHTHPWEHEVFVLEGEGVVVGEGGREWPIRPGTVVFVAPNEPHQFRNTGNTTLKFICLVPAHPWPPGGSGMGEAVLHLDSSNFDEVVGKADKPVVVDFWAEWCPPCLMMAPIFEEVAREFSGKAIFAKVNVDEAPELANRYNIMAIPTIMVFVGGKPVDKIVGALGKEGLVALLMKHLGGP